jgi:hypothetical protein
MSDNDRPEVEAYRELEKLVRQLGDELAAYRRRALLAEQRLADAGLGTGPSPSGKTVESDIRPSRLRERVAELERENAVLRGRLEAASSRTRSMLDRVHFLRQQVQVGATNEGGNAKGARGTGGGSPE